MVLMLLVPSPGRMLSQSTVRTANLLEFGYFGIIWSVYGAYYDVESCK